MKVSARWKVPAMLAIAVVGVAISGPAVGIEPTDGPTYYPNPEGQIIRYSEPQIAAALEDGIAKEAAGQQPAADDALEDELIASSTAEGSPLTDEDIAVLHLGEDIAAAVPETTTLAEVEIIGDKLQGGEVDAVSVAVDAHATEEATVSSAGPGMGEWGSRADGQYVITMRDPLLWSNQVIGHGTFLWQRSRFLNDGSGTTDWWKYSRKAIGQAVNIPGDNWQIAKLRVQSYPYDSVQPGLKAWTDIEPASDFPGACSGHTVNTNVNTPIFGAGYSFTDCDQYVVWHNPFNPGSYHITMDQGTYVSEGTRSAGYTVGWTSVQGNPGSQHDYQRILMRKSPTGRDATCSATDTSKVCSDW